MGFSAVAAGIGAVASVAGAGASIIGSMGASKAAGQAAGAQVGAANQATALQREMYQTNRADMAPWRTAGENALTQYQYGMGMTPDMSTYESQLANLAVPEWKKRIPKGYDETGHFVGVERNALTQGAPYDFGSGFVNAEGQYVGRVPSDNIFDQFGAGGWEDYGGGGSQGGKFRNKKYEEYLRAKADYDIQKKRLSGIIGQTPQPIGDKLKTTPGYQFRLQEGINALDRGAAARGLSLSGAQLKGVQGYGEGMASQEYTNYMNRLASLAGLGQQAAGTTGQYGINYANQAGQNTMAAGNARASGYINQANAFTGGVQGVGNALSGGMQNYMMYNTLNRGGGGGGGGYTSRYDPYVASYGNYADIYGGGF